MQVERQVALPVKYKGIDLDCSYRIDLLVEKEVIVELKAVEVILPIHKAQVITYLRLGGWKRGLLLNFNVDYLHNGIRCLANEYVHNEAQRKRRRRKIV